MNAFELVIDPRQRPVGAGTVRRLLPYRKRRMVGPFVFTDLIGLEEIPAGRTASVDAHPHIGLATVTYLLDGRMVHRDSTGAVQTIEPGAVNWMTAGSGVTHTERSVPQDVALARTVAGLQLWVALPEEAEECEPSFLHAPASSIPSLSHGDSTVRLAVGDGWGEQSPVAGASPLVLAEVALREGSPVPISVPHEELAVLAVTGSISVDDHPLAEGQLAILERTAATLSGEGTAMVLGGDRLGPRHIWWNFVHSDPDRIEAAKADWMAQRFPTVPDDHDPWIPLPGS